MPRDVFEQNDVFMNIHISHEIHISFLCVKLETTNYSKFPLATFVMSSCG